jgi:formylglycine-generating enzyme required for sulfatase activity
MGHAATINNDHSKLVRSESASKPLKTPIVGVLLAMLMLVGGCSRSTSSPEAAVEPASRDSGDSSRSHLPPPSASVDPSVIHFVSIPGGTARLGSLSNEPGRNPALERLTTYTVASFEMSVSEITRAQWFPIMEPHRSASISGGNLPITKITWYEATQFCNLLTIKTGIVHRLPTEVEWEYACRAGSSELLAVWEGNCSLSDAITTFHRGDSGKLLRGIKASCNIDSGRIQPVGQFRPNRFGLVDMHGNCWEWLTLESPLSEPPSPLHAPIRGGSAISTNPLDARAANRAWQKRNDAAESIGLRIVREISQ